MGFLSYVREKIHDIRAAQDAKRSPAVHGAAFSTEQSPTEDASRSLDKEAMSEIRRKSTDIPPRQVVKASTSSQTQLDEGQTRTVSQLSSKPSASGPLGGVVATERTTTPVAMERTTTPVAMERTTTPVAMEPTTTPVAMERTTTPVAMERTTTPVAMERTTTPVAKAPAVSADLSKPFLLNYDLTTAKSLALSAKTLATLLTATGSPQPQTPKPSLLNYDMTSARSLAIGADDRRLNGLKTMKMNMETLNFRLEVAKSETTTKTNGGQPDEKSTGPKVRLCLFRTHLSPDHQVLYNQTQAQTLLYGHSEINKRTAAPAAKAADIGSTSISSMHQVIYNESVAKQLMIAKKSGSACPQKMSRLALYEITQARILDMSKLQQVEDFTDLTNLAIYNLTEARMLATARMGSLREKRPGKVAAESSAKNRRVQMAPTAQYAQTQAQILRYK